jgi:hypothetical protein
MITIDHVIAYIVRSPEQRSPKPAHGRIEVAVGFVLNAIAAPGSASGDRDRGIDDRRL